MVEAVEEVLVDLRVGGGYFEGIVGEVDGPEVPDGVEGGDAGDLVAVEGEFCEVFELGEDGDEGRKVADVPACQRKYLNSMLTFITCGCVSNSSISSYILRYNRNTHP